jgi:hypothetical protein
MTTIPLDAMVRRASRMAEQMFDEEGAVDMFWLIDTPAGITRILSPVFAENPTQGCQVKDAINEAMREFLREHDATRFVRVAEVWTVQEVPSTSELPDKGPDKGTWFSTSVPGSLDQVFGRRSHSGKLFVDDFCGPAAEQISQEFTARTGISVEVVTGAEAEDLLSRAKAEWRAKGSGTLEDHPLRQEQIVLMASDGREVLISSRDIIRPPGGKPYLSKLSEIERPKELTGAWVDLTAEVLRRN